MYSLLRWSPQKAQSHPAMNFLQPRGWLEFSSPTPRVGPDPHTDPIAAQMEGGLGLQLRLRGRGSSAEWGETPLLGPCACCRDGPGTEALRSRAVSQKKEGVGTGGVLSPCPAYRVCPSLMLLDQVGRGAPCTAGWTGWGWWEGLKPRASPWCSRPPSGVAPVGGMACGSGQNQVPERSRLQGPGPPSPQDSSYSCGCCIAVRSGLGDYNEHSVIVHQGICVPAGGINWKRN